MVSWILCTCDNCLYNGLKCHGKMGKLKQEEIDMVYF